MDDRQRRLRIERMKREKQRQLRRRRRQKIIIKRCLMIAACVLVVLLSVSAIWGLVKPDKTSKNSEEAAVDTVVDVEAGTQEEGTEDDVTEPDIADESEESEITADAAEGVNADAPAQTAAIQDPEGLQYAVPGWQVDSTGWWYALDENTYYTNGWQEIDGQEYYFNSQGYMQTGWAVVGSRGCYFSEAGTYEPDKESKMIAMTFDDGPGDYTSELLDILEENNAKATFFMLGENIEAKGADVIPRMVELGCELGNHSYNHPNLKDLSDEQIKEQFDKTDELIAALTGGATAALARTPFGSQDDNITGVIGKPCIYWSLDTLDWETKDVDSNISKVLDNVEDGEIVLMHDIWPTTVESCKTIIPKLIEEGYQLVTVSELATAKGVNLEDGITYYEFYPGDGETEDPAEES